ncbi:hypothetical protein J25TS5_06760 [Paenibacillus faecis]|nr:hypothetical protein J25TS5_06760 [Paenibacillus faecis]
MTPAVPAGTIFVLWLRIKSRRRRKIQVNLLPKGKVGVKVLRLGTPAFLLLSGKEPEGLKPGKTHAL